MIKPQLILIFLIYSTVLFGQTTAEKINTLSTIEEAEAYFEKHPEAEGEIFTATPEIDGAIVLEMLADKKVGAIFCDEESTFKIISKNQLQAFRVSYIFLDESKITLKDINKRRNAILKAYKNGKAFDLLANQYTMDSSKDGDLGWFTEGMMVPEFETAVKQHRLNDVFTIDIPDRKWYYVVLKTFDDKMIDQLILIKIKGCN